MTTKEELEAERKKRLAGGFGGIEGSATANPSGLSIQQPIQKTRGLGQKENETSSVAQSGSGIGKTPLATGLTSDRVGPIQRSGTMSVISQPQNSMALADRFNTMADRIRQEREERNAAERTFSPPQKMSVWEREKKDREARMDMENSLKGVSIGRAAKIRQDYYQTDKQAETARERNAAELSATEQKVQQDQQANFLTHKLGQQTLLNNAAIEEQKAVAKNREVSFLEEGRNKRALLGQQIPGQRLLLDQARYVQDTSLAGTKQELEQRRQRMDEAENLRKSSVDLQRLDIERKKARTEAEIQEEEELKKKGKKTIK